MKILIVKVYLILSDIITGNILYNFQHLGFLKFIYYFTSSGAECDIFSINSIKICSWVKQNFILLLQKYEIRQKCSYLTSISNKNNQDFKDYYKNKNSKI